MTYDVDAVRALYPALADGWAYLDGAAGTQVPASVIDAEGDAYRAGIGNHGGYFAGVDALGRDHRTPPGRRSPTWSTRPARTAWCSAQHHGADLPASPTRWPGTWRDGDEIVVTRLDHDANVRPWVQAAARAGAMVRWAEPVLPTLDLPAAAVTELIGPRTRLVAVTAASNVIGTRPDVRAIADAAHAVGALVYVDGVHATPHGAVDVAALGADFYATSAYKWSGPHLAAVVADPALLDDAAPGQARLGSDEVPDRFERGTAPFAEQAGLAAAVDHLASLASVACPATAPGAEAGRRERLVASMTAVEAYESALLARMVEALTALPRVHRVGAPTRQAPTIWFTVEGYHPDQVARACAAAGVNVWSGHNYAWELAGFLGIRDSGSAVRAGLSCYSTQAEVDRLVDVVAALPTTPPVTGSLSLAALSDGSLSDGSSSSRPVGGALPGGAV